MSGNQPDLFEGIDVYPDKLEDRHRRSLFGKWLALNREAVGELVGWAVWLDMMGKPVSVGYLFEKERYEGTAELHPVEFKTYSGEERAYSLNNNDRALFARWLKERHPGMNVSTRRSKWDA